MFVVGTLAWLGAPSSASACQYLSGSSALEIREDAATPEEPLLTPQLRVAQIKRGVGPRGATRTSCDEAGWIALAAEDPQQDVGYELAVVSGTPPAQFQAPTAPLQPDENGELLLGWSDEATDTQEPFSFEVVATPVHVSGTRGEPSAPIAIDHPGTEGAACSSTGQQGASRMATTLGLMVFVFAAARTVRRRRH